MTKLEFARLFNELQDEDEILLVIDGNDVDFDIEPITVSCDDPTPVGIVITNKEKLIQH